jgi:hypothetical protein
MKIDEQGTIISPIAELTEDEPVGPKLLTLSIQETESLIS